MGAGRDTRALTDALTRGTSTVIGGPIGSGKTFLVQRVAELLADRSIAPLLIRGASALADVEWGAVTAVTDPRAAELREGNLAARVLLVVDDAQHLDVASAAGIARAVHRGQATALIGISEPRLRGDTPTAAVHHLQELWLSGVAERLDLARLSADEGAQLLGEFAGGHAFDGVSRTAILWQADGSRMLLRALVDHALDAVVHGDDPVQAIDDVPVHSRLAAALGAHIRGFDDDTLRALVLLGIAPGLTFGDAARFVPSSVLNELRGAGLVTDDRTIAHRLSANRALARAAARTWGAARADHLARDVQDRLLHDGGLWWSAPIARALAERWLRELPDASALVDVPSEIIVRVLADAAHEANDHGDASSAAAYATWAGDLASTPVLSVEEHLAHAVLRSSGTPELHLDALPAQAHRRAMPLAIALALRVPAPLSTVVDGTEADPAHQLAAARAAMDALEIGRARAIVDGLRVHLGLTTQDRIDMELLAGMASAYLGRQDDMRRELRSAERLLRSGGRRGSAAEMLSARCRDLAARTVAGVDDADVLSDLDSERQYAVQTGGVGLALAGVASILTLLRRGHVLEARVELAAALRRSPLYGGEGQGMILLETALGLALFGYTDEARDLLDALDPPAEPSPLFQHMRHATCATLAVAEGRWDDAHHWAAEAWRVAAPTDAVMLQIRCLHRLVVVGHPDADDALDRMRTIAESVRSDVANMMVASAERAVAGAADEPSISAALTHLCLDLCPPELLRANRTPSGAAADDAMEVLTPRELEIARLVGQGLSNRQIAHALFLSVRTVESHIYQARAKLSARNRADLGSLVTDDGRKRDEPQRAWG
ncbi:LuxR C-terminal-related transcriptional regulator [Microbacterium sp. cf332]|uniref:LuxR C-terminal-related transcriptional regulator n=1 Tax=Microbacterium sp. cf332 TaxID=1761804 RepID=UPI0008925374|nr:LuxR C-terminal-related transcriptional regulator [Microbacterium sp. cf332]SDQ20851.1 regulatory protein, luxR family [Microbacterium sp. cf332]